MAADRTELFQPAARRFVLQGGGAPTKTTGPGDMSTHADCLTSAAQQGACQAEMPYTSTCGLVAMTSAPHAEGRQFDPGQV